MRTIKAVTRYVESGGASTEIDRTAIIQAVQLLVGAKPDGDFGPLSLAALKRTLDAAAHDTIPVPSDEIEVVEELPPTQKDGSGSVRIELTLGQRALAWCLEEAERWGAGQVSLARTSEYLRGCSRPNTAGLGAWLAQTNASQLHSFCAAAQGFAEAAAAGAQFRESLCPWRAGALELKADAEHGARPNERWGPLSEFYDEEHDRFIKAPPSGSIVVYQNRADANRGHVERLIEATAAGIRSVGANENNRRWVVDKSPVGWRMLERADGQQRLYLLGFIVPLEVLA